MVKIGGKMVNVVFECPLREKRRRIFKFRRFLIQQIFRKFITNAHMGNIFFQMLPICNRLVVR